MTDLIRDRTDYYFFVSSTAVYDRYDRPNIDETAPTQSEPDTYGGEKARAEGVVEAAFPEAWGAARCHAILGSRDDGEAYHYWIQRFSHYATVLAPGTGADPVQYVDVADVATWILDCVQQTRVGTHNVCGPPARLPLSAFLERTASAIDSSTRLVWVDADFLRLDRGVQSFTQMPFWAPLDEDPGFYQISNAKAVAAGLRFRPIEQTARDAAQWYADQSPGPVPFPRDGWGISRAREEEILAAWSG